MLKVCITVTHFNYRNQHSLSWDPILLTQLYFEVFFSLSWAIHILGSLLPRKLEKSPPVFIHCGHCSGVHWPIHAVYSKAIILVILIHLDLQKSSTVSMSSAIILHSSSRHELPISMVFEPFRHSKEKRSRAQISIISTIQHFLFQFHNSLWKQTILVFPNLYFSLQKSVQILILWRKKIN